ncbi:hypothetical protein [Agromyces seonyuensis]|uniref:Uncharacterized protein n=1 Tax=Agromyces seonyuensis TaxID=2662446 RepID=A0A6I4P4D8_9MICO|nr:hypothetical protein [Agromyces seonyuensis]MWB99149.1 hypothetical protein [Agromyces seonyuensis]
MSPGSDWFGLMVSVLPVGVAVAWAAMRFLRVDRTVPPRFHGRALLIIGVLFAAAVLLVLAAMVSGPGRHFGDGPAFALILLATLLAGNAFLGFIVLTLLRIFPQAPRAPGA